MPELFDAPLEDKDHLKRVVLFSDTPTDDSAAANMPTDSLQGGVEPQSLLLRICDSEWSTLPFDLTKLQSEPI